MEVEATVPDVVDAEIPDVKLPASVSTHAKSKWPCVSFKQSSTIGSDLVVDKYTTGWVTMKAFRENGARLHPSSSTDKFTDPDFDTQQILKTTEDMFFLPINAPDVVYDLDAKRHKVKGFNLDLFVPPVESDDRWKHMAYDNLLMVYNGFEDHQSNNAAGEAASLQPPTEPEDVGAFNSRPDVRARRNRVENVSGGFSPMEFRQLNLRALGNRLENALTVDTPRRTKALRSVFNLVHSAFPWYKPYSTGDALYQNFTTLLKSRAPYSIFNSYAGMIPRLPISLKPLPDFYSYDSSEANTDNLVYDPFMVDAGTSILNISSSVADHVSSVIRTHAAMGSVSYMDQAALLQQMTAMSSNRASSMSTLLASMSNSAASSAFEPVITSLACNFSKIATDIPSNARQTTVLFVVSLLSMPSALFDNTTKSLLHNMMVGMVMPTMPVLNVRPKAEAEIDFPAIRKYSMEHRLMPTPALGPGATFQRVQIHNDCIRLLSHFHGLVIPDSDSIDGYAVFPMSVSKQWSQQDMLDGNSLGKRGAPKMAASPDQISHYDQYFYHFGVLPNEDSAEFDELYRSYSVFRRYDNPTTRIGKTILGSTFDTYITSSTLLGEGARLPSNIVNSSVTMDRDVLSRQTPPAGYTGPGLYIAWVVSILRVGPRSIIRVESVPLVEAPTNKFAFSDDVTEITPDNAGEFDASDFDFTSGKHYDVDTKYLTVEVRKVESLSACKVRPIMRSMLPIWHSSDSTDADNNGFQNRFRNVILRILTAFRTVGKSNSEQNYLSVLGSLIFNRRWDMLMDYITDIASTTIFTDYCPSGFSPMIVPAYTEPNTYNPVLQRVPSVATSPFRIDMNGGQIVYSLFAPDAVAVNSSVRDAAWRFEAECNHNTTTLDASALVALQFLGVAPRTTPDISGSLALNLDSKGFNHDVMVMRCAARYFKMHYENQNAASQRSFDSQHSQYKIDKFKIILSSIRRVLPVCSSLTSKLDSSIEQYDLRQNQFWKPSNFVDYNAVPIINHNYDGANSQYEDSYQLPFIRCKPVIPMPLKNREGIHVYGIEDTIYDQIRNIAERYIQDVNSRLNRTEWVKLDGKSRTVNSNPLSRSFSGIDPATPGPVGVPRGEPYIADVYTDSPMVEYLAEDFDSISQLTAENTFDIANLAYGKNGVSNTRSIEMVYAEWLYRLRLNTGEVYPVHYIRNSHGFYLKWDKVKTLYDAFTDKLLPKVNEYVIEEKDIPVMFTTPSDYVGKPLEVYSMTGYPTPVVPVLMKNQGPFVSRLVNRNPIWPANSDFTSPGALTENLRMEQFPDDRTCSEYNSEALGVVYARKNPISWMDPSEMLVMVYDPIPVAYHNN